MKNNSYVSLHPLWMMQFHNVLIRAQNVISNNENRLSDNTKYKLNSLALVSLDTAEIGNVFILKELILIFSKIGKEIYGEKFIEEINSLLSEPSFLFNEDISIDEDGEG